MTIMLNSSSVLQLIALGFEPCVVRG